MDRLKYLGIEYRNEGEDSADKMNCAELMFTVMRDEFGKKLPQTDTENGPHTVSHFMANLSLWDRIDAPREGCMVSFCINGMMHCGVMLNKREFMHVLKGRNVSIDTIDRIIWRNRIEGFYEYNG